MNLVYAATLTPDPDGGFLVTFSDVPDAITQGATRADALANAAEALGLALRGYLADGEAIPEAKSTDGSMVAVDPGDAVKIAVIDRFRKSDISKSELARRLGKSEGEARRILDPDYPSKIGTMQDALKAMGQTIVVTTMELA